MELRGNMHPCDRLIIESQQRVIRTCLQIIKNQKTLLDAVRYG